MAVRDVADATPNVGVVRVGEVANTKSPLPVSSVTADAKLAEDGVAKKVATLAAKPDTPDEIGKPVQLVRVPEPGVPNAGVMKVGVLLNTKRPVPLSSDITPANSAEVVAANTLSLLPVVVKVPAVGNVTLEAAVVVSVNAKAPTVARVEPLANVNVALVAGAVKATLLILVAVATPKTGVTRVGVLANTKAPLPVSSVTADAKLADDGVAKKVATLAPKPDTPDEIGRPVQLVKVPEVGVPSNGVVRVGDVANTKSPVPVSSVTAVAKLAEDGVAKKVATPVANPETPDEIGKPVQLVRVPEPGVPNAGVMKVGVLLKTNRPVPLSSDITPANSAEVVAAWIDNLLPLVISVPAVGNVTLVAAVVVSVNAKAPTVESVELSANVNVAAVVGAVKATLLMLVAVATPKTGVIRVGVLANTFTPVPVLSVSADAKLAEDGVAKKVATLAPKPDTPDEIGSPVQLVRVPEVGVPSNGVVRVGDVANTKSPVPVSSDITPANSEEEVAACTDNLSVVTTSVLLVGIVVVLIVPETVALEYTSVLVDGL